MLVVKILLLSALTAVCACSSPPVEKEKPPSVIIIGGDVGGSDGSTEPLECGPGRSACGGACVDLTLDAENCGACGVACGEGFVCSVSECAEIPSDCRGEIPCPRRYFCDEATGFCEQGCTTNDDCTGGAFCELASHDCLCPTDGDVLCGASCVPEGPSSCGVDCVTCRAPSNGSATCEEGVCGQSCDSGDLLCGNTCASCPTDGVAATACDGTSCVAADCDFGYELCNGVCAACPNADPDAVFGCDGTQCVVTDCPQGTRLCSGECAECPSNTGGTLQCSGTDCTFSCGAGTHACDGRCVSDDDINNCGASCAQCPGDPNGDAVCAGGSCELTCDTDFRECAGGCAQCPTLAVASTRCAGATCVAATCVGDAVPCSTGCCQPPPIGAVLSRFDADWVEMALDSFGYPHIIVGQSGSFDYAWWDGAQWQTNALSLTMSSPQLEVDSNGEAHVVGTDFNLGVRYATGLKTGSPTVVTIDGDAFGDASPDLVIDGSGVVHVVWAAPAVGLTREIRYVNSTNFTQSSLVEDASSAAPRLALSGTKLHVMYYHVQLDNLQHRTGSTTSSGWTARSNVAGTASVDNPVGTTYEYSDIEIGANGEGWATWQGFAVNGGRYNGTLWTDRGAAGNTGGQRVDLGLAPNGNPHIVYETTFNEVRRAYRTTSWQDVSIVSEGKSPEIAFDAGGTGHIAYYSVTNGELMYERF